MITDGIDKRRLIFIGFFLIRFSVESYTRIVSSLMYHFERAINIDAVLLKASQR